ncbi:MULTISPECIES: hypothetical protein [unclassified Bradyrhizobium]|uniref:hypothetical protein n=1 Tax=unclassified Bradyrhizobium TaxID=2631580 RepID=UPI0028E74609|nr:MULTISPECIES: hypothetical protein [unclassified Bradyrhizobium]
MALNFAERIKPVDPQRFKFAIGVFGAAAELKGPAPNPSQFPINLVDDDGSVTEIRLADRAENRGLLAINREFRGATDLESISFRILSMGEVVRMERLSKMGVIQLDEAGQLLVHDSVIYALARAPFRKSGKLDKAAFVAVVKSEFDRMEANHPEV